MKVYLLGPAEPDEFQTVASALDLAGHDVVIHASNADLRFEIALLTTCDAVCFMDDWWTDTNSVCLQTIAAWLKFKVVDTKGQALPTMSLRG